MLFENRTKKSSAIELKSNEAFGENEMCPKCAVHLILWIKNQNYRLTHQMATGVQKDWWPKG